MLRNIALVLLFLVVVSVAALLVVKHQADKNFYAGYSADYPLKAEEQEAEPVEGTVKAFGQLLPARYNRQRFSFESEPGERVPALIATPLNPPEAPLPVIILVHGSHQEKEFLEEICTPFNEAVLPWSVSTSTCGATGNPGRARRRDCSGIAAGKPFTRFSG